jgi:vancomycin resistance protein YoaR
MSTPRPSRGAWIRFGVALAAFLAFLGVVTGYQSSPSAGRVEGVRIGGEPVQATGNIDVARLGQSLGQKAGAVLAGKVTLLAGDEKVEIEVAKLATFDKTGLEVQLKALSSGAAKDGGLDLPLPIKIDAARANEVLQPIKDRLDRLPKDAKLDLEHRKVLPHEEGLLVNLIDSLVAVEQGLQRGQTEIAVALVKTQPKVTAKDLANIDVSQVLGSWETRYGNDPDRTFNLKVAAEKLNGRIIKPGELMSFNEVVGDRSESNGFKTAPVIQAGELVDGIGGGTCQISSTLYAASFFAGLDNGKYTPHSRPSHYITMGLDATVVWPRVDMELKNPYEFPIAVHASVSQGRVRMEILGPKRDYTVGFEREILEEKEFETIERMDDTLPVGARVVDQAGVKGYRMKRHRYVYGPKNKVLKHNVRVLYYPPTKEFIRVGTKPVSPDDPPAKLPESKTHSSKEPPKHYRLVR